MHPGSCSGKGEKRARWKCWHHATPLVQRGFASLHTCTAATALTHPSFICLFSPHPRLQEQVWERYPKFPHCLNFWVGNSSKQERTKRVSVEAWSTCASVCLPVQKCVCTICHWDSALNTMSTGCSHLWFWYMLRALFFSQKNFLLDSLLWQLEMAGKVMAVFICHLRLHLWRTMLQRPGKHHHANPVAEGARTQCPFCSCQRQ